MDLGLGIDQLDLDAELLPHRRDRDRDLLVVLGGVVVELEFERLARPVTGRRHQLDGFGVTRGLVHLGPGDLLRGIIGSAIGHETVGGELAGERDALDQHLAVHRHRQRLAHAHVVERRSGDVDRIEVHPGIRRDV